MRWYECGLLIDVMQLSGYEICENARYGQGNGDAQVWSMRMPRSETQKTPMHESRYHYLHLHLSLLKASRLQ